MEWEEISKLALKDNPMPEDAPLYEHEAYQALRLLYAMRRLSRSADEKYRIVHDAAQVKGEFLRSKKQFISSIKTVTAYKMMQLNPDARCSEILQKVDGIDGMEELQNV